MSSAATGYDNADYAELRALGLDEEEIAILRAGSGVQCETPNDSEYHSPDAVRLGLPSDSRQLSTVVGSRNGIRGVIIPRATRGGASRGFDHNTPARVNIVDIVAKRQVAVDLDAVTSSQFNGLVSPDISSDPQAVAAIAFRRLARQQGHEVVPLGDSEGVPRGEPRPAPRGANGQYTVPPSTNTGRQLSMHNPSARPRTPFGRPQPVAVPQEAFTATPPSAGEDAPALPVVRPVGRPPASFGSRRPGGTADQTLDRTPRVEVRFEHPSYEMTWRYHHAVVSDDGAVLALVFDRRCQTANRFEPKPPEGKRPEDEPICVQIVGQPVVYKVCVTGTRYTIADFEHQLFVIVDTIDTTAQPAPEGVEEGYDLGLDSGLASPEGLG